LINPLRIPNTARIDFTPLCPWKDPNHEKFFAPVDHTEEAFQRFIDRIESIRQGSKPPPLAVVAWGAEGCGKTSLMHRCAKELRDRISKSGTRAEVVDLTMEAVSGASEERLLHFCARLVDSLRVSKLLNTPEQDALEKRRDDPSVAIPFLGDLLERLEPPIHLLVLLPGLELLNELKRLATLARPYLSIFTETSSEEPIHVLKSLSTGALSSALSPVVSLEVGALCIADGWLFVEARLAASGTPHTVLINKSTVDRYMTERTKSRGGTSIRELELILLAVSDVAADREDEVQYDDFSSYYLQHGVIPTTHSTVI
jgi:hypothetical protein